MIYTLKEYSTIKKVSHDTILRRIKRGNMPSSLIIKRLSGKRGYIIEDPEKK